MRLWHTPFCIEHSRGPASPTIYSASSGSHAVLLLPGKEHKYRRAAGREVIVIVQDFRHTCTKTLILRVGLVSDTVIEDLHEAVSVLYILKLKRQIWNSRVLATQNKMICSPYISPLTYGYIHF